VQRDDSMESFVEAETLKYMYLLVRHSLSAALLLSYFPLRRSRAQG